MERYLLPLLALAGMVYITFVFNSIINVKIKKIMADLTQFEAVLARIDAATTGIAGQLRDLKEQIKNQGLPKDVEDSILAKMEEKAVALEAIGKDPENPVPDEGTGEGGEEGSGSEQGGGE